jgi:hypothetical protein
MMKLTNITIRIPISDLHDSHSVILLESMTITPL